MTSSPSPVPFYESEGALGEYLLMHYGEEAEVLPFPFGPHEALNYPERCVSSCLVTAWLPEHARALDLGCAVGRSSFALSRHCQAVVGIDYSHRFIQSAQYLKEHQCLPYSYVVEGLQRRESIAHIPKDVYPERVQFEQGDASQLRADLGPFDVVLMANLIDRLAHPQACLEQLPRLVRPGGQLILTSPYTWLPDYTPVSHWLGAREANGPTTLDGLRAVLEPMFNLHQCRDLPFLIREHVRKYQWSVAQATVWRRCIEPTGS